LCTIVANMTLSITFMAPIQGLASSLDTLCAQAYGNKSYHLVGIQCQRVAVFLGCLSIPIAALWLFSEPIIAYVVTDPNSAHLAALYLKIMVLAMPGIIIFEVGKRLLQAQGFFVATTYILLIAAPLNVFVSWVLVWKLGLGFVGAPVAVVITRNLLPLLLVLYVKLVDGEKCWGGFDKRAFANWAIMSRLAIPSMIMVEAELLAFEMMTLICSTFGTDYLAAQGILVTLAIVSWQIPFAMSIAASSRVATLIGAGQADGAIITSQMVCHSLSEKKWKSCQSTYILIRLSFRIAVSAS